MTTVTRDGVTYEVEDGWRDMSTFGESCRASNVFLANNGVVCTTNSSEVYNSRSTIAWRPIVPPKVERWRAREGGLYLYVSDTGKRCSYYDRRQPIDDERYAIGNYFEDEVQLDASNKAKVMRDPESER